MRWRLGVDGDGQASGGPDYCKTVCGVPTKPRCTECTRPVLLPENDDAAALYAACAGRWYRTADGHPLGFDYPQVMAAAQLLTLRRPAAAFRGLRIMGKELLRLSALRQERDHGN